ncbi:hypothetical protein LHJ74_12400 [Streptomyces sp. N2-109]|uniref:L-fucose isomerase C-terminal domain-containing protein n=1 Tax=Streptomyces gossypii TaxID=2883101 RepID=A0ABT2JS43_9ACTN|nr:hypothetical protein [Streptomyces gossypii]MCT2590700.1 hypothetical protein [Streptomyces gossypii]
MPRVALIPTARPTFATDQARVRADSAHELLASLGADVVGPRELVMTPEDVEAAAPALDGADLVVNVCATFSDATPALRLYTGLDRPLLLWAFREPGETGDRLWLNSLCGANLFAHAVVREGGTVRLIHGDPDEPAVRDALACALAGELPAPPVLETVHGERAAEEPVRAGLERLRGRRIGLVGDAPPGFTPSEYDPELVAELFGITMERLTVDAAIDAAQRVDPGERETEREAATAAQPSLAQVDHQQSGLAAAVTTSLRDWTADRQLAAAAVRCWPEFPTRLGACPCSALSRLADEGTPTACERDVYGAVTMLLMESLGAGTTYLVDTVDVDSDRNVLRLWHCGAAATSLAADPANATQSVHCNRKLGVAGNFPLRTGPVVITRLTEDPARPGRLRLLIAAGESLPAPNRFQGNTAEVRVDRPADGLVQSLVTGGFPHHTVLAWSDVRPALRTAADLLGIPVTEW